MDGRSWPNISAALQVYLSHYFVSTPSPTWAELQKKFGVHGVDLYWEDISEDLTPVPSCRAGMSVLEMVAGSTRCISKDGLNLSTLS
jgi:hypothetical protein